jgi:hypothetical protein
MKKLHPTVESLLSEIDAFIARTGTDQTNFGLDVINDGHFVKRLRHGRVPKLQTIDRVRGYIASKTKAVRQK